MRLYKAALFDLDGTLVDNYNAIHSTLAESFSLYGIPEPSYDEVFKTVGGSILITAGKILAAHGNDETLARPMRALPKNISRKDVRRPPHNAVCAGNFVRAEIARRKGGVLYE